MSRRTCACFDVVAAAAKEVEVVPVSIPGSNHDQSDYCYELEE